MKKEKINKEVKYKNRDKNVNPLYSTNPITNIKTKDNGVVINISEENARLAKVEVDSNHK